MTAHDILSNAFVVTSGGTRLAQFRKCLDAVGLDGCLPREWRWCRIEGEGSMGNAVAQYSLVRHALEAKLPFLVVFEDAAPSVVDGGPTAAWEPVRTHGDGSRAAELLGWAPSTPFADGVRAFADWWRAGTGG